MSDLPVGWILAGSAPRDYELAIDRSERHSGTSSGRLRARAATPGGFGTVMQELLADDYRGRRVRLSAFVQSRDVVGECGLWLRVDGAERRVLAFENLKPRQITGTTDWTRHEIVLDVAGAAEAIAFGLILDGTGAAWLDDVGFEIVGLDVPLTRARQPRNLDFEESA